MGAGMGTPPPYQKTFLGFKKRLCTQKNEEKTVGVLPHTASMKKKL